jgi:acetyl esterase/lipase
MSCTVKKEKDIVYKEDLHQRDVLLDIYHPRDQKGLKDVLVFIHGGSWNSGNKNLYWWMGRNFARKGIVSVIINYPLAPENYYDVMANYNAFAVKWVKEHVANYGGNPERIYLMGHSAGAHLAALVSMDEQFFKSAGMDNPVKGVILNDAFGLDMFQYLTKSKSQPEPYSKVFTDDPAIWKQASPYHHIKNNGVPFAIYTGEKTYDTIKIQSVMFKDKLIQHGIRTDFKEIKNKKHIGMITQLFWGWNKRYQEIIGFMRKT